MLRSHRRMTTKSNGLFEVSHKVLALDADLGFQSLILFGHHMHFEAAR
jgi:hypothetical protein